MQDINLQQIDRMQEATAEEFDDAKIVIATGNPSVFKRLLGSILNSKPIARIAELIAEHNTSPTAHNDLREEIDSDESRLRRQESLTSGITQRSSVTWGATSEMEIGLLDRSQQITTANVYSLNYSSNITIAEAQTNGERVFVRIPADANIKHYRIAHSGHEPYTAFKQFLDTYQSQDYYEMGGIARFATGETLTAQKASETEINRWNDELEPQRVIDALGGHTAGITQQQLTQILMAYVTETAFNTFATQNVGAYTAAIMDAVERVQRGAAAFVQLLPHGSPSRSASDIQGTYQLSVTGFRPDLVTINPITVEFNLDGIAVHTANINPANPLPPRIPIVIDATEAGAIAGNLQSSDTEIPLSITFKDGANIVDNGVITFPFVFDASLAPPPDGLTYHLAHTYTGALTGNTWVASGYTLVAGTSLKIEFIDKQAGADRAIYGSEIIRADAIRSLDAYQVGGNVTSRRGYSFLRRPESEAMDYGRDNANQLLLGNKEGGNINNNVDEVRIYEVRVA